MIFPRYLWAEFPSIIPGILVEECRFHPRDEFSFYVKGRKRTWVGLAEWLQLRDSRKGK